MPAIACHPPNIDHHLANIAGTLVHIACDPSTINWHLAIIAGYPANIDLSSAKYWVSSGEYPASCTRH